MSEYNPHQESNVDKLKYTVSEAELVGAVEQSERALALTLEDAIEWPGLGGECSLLRFTHPVERNTALLASRTYTDEYGKNFTNRYMLEIETGNMLAYHDTAGYLPPTAQPTGPEDLAALNDIIQSAIEFTETISNLRDKLGGAVFELLGISEPEDIDADAKNLFDE